MLRNQIETAVKNEATGRLAAVCSQIVRDPPLGVPLMSLSPAGVAC
jgi:hypothetical protein